MKTKELKELKEKKEIELVKLLEEKRMAVNKFTGQINSGREKNLKKGMMLRRDIAQIMTILSMRGKEETK